MHTSAPSDERAPFLSVVIPAYNEERRILPTLQQLSGYLGTRPYTWEVLVVDDGSADKTAALVTEFSAAHPNFSLLSVPHRGKGFAVQAGMLQASGAYRFLCDADLSMPIEQLERFLPPKLCDFDVAVGSREMLGARRFNEPRVRHIQGRLFNLFVRFVAVPGVSDTQCGFKCFRGDVAELLFPLQRTPGWGFDVELLFLARMLHLQLMEVPIDWHHDSDSRSHRLRNGISMGVGTLRLRWSAWRGIYGVLEPSLLARGDNKKRTKERR